MNKDYESPQCCDDFMNVINIMGYLDPVYIAFNCERCGKIKVCRIRHLDKFEEASA